MVFLILLLFQRFFSLVKLADSMKMSILGSNEREENPDESRRPAWLAKKTTSDNSFGGPKTALKQMEIEKKKQEEEEAKEAEMKRMAAENERLLQEGRPTFSSQ